MWFKDQDIYCEDRGEIVRYGSERIELQFDRETGRWLSLTDKQDGAELLRAGDLISPILLTVGGRTQASRGFNQMFSVLDAETIGLRWRLEKYACEPSDKGAWFTVCLREGDWRVDLRYGLRPDLARLERQVRIGYFGDEEALLRHFVLRTPFAWLGAPPDCHIEAPGHPLKPGRRVSSLSYGSWGQLQQGAFCDAPAWRPPLIGIHHPHDRRALAFWAYTQTEPFYPLADRADEGVMFSHRVYLADRFEHGHTLEWSAQYLQVYHDEWLAALEQFQQFYDEVGFAVPTDVPEWAQSINLYEVHVGTLTGTTLAPYPTYEPLIEDLPRIREKGFDVVYLMPHVPYPSYAVIDYMNMEIQYGSEAGLRALIDRAHEIGLKVFVDVTLHGVLDRQARRLMAELEGTSPTTYPMEPSMPEVHPYLVEHPEWFSRTESGEVATTYTYAFDHANASWQDFMARVFRFYVQEYDIDGFRVDSHTWNFFPNWARDLPYPASRSFYGSAQLFQRIRRELKAIKPDVVFYTETAGPLLHSSHELGYNYDETWMLLSTLPLASRRGLLCHFAHLAQVTTERMNARDIALWLAQRRLVMPRGAIKVRHLDCHDSYWHPGEFRRHTFGSEAAKAIVGCFAFIDGGFMDYHGADEGSEAFYRRVMHLRRTQPALKQGTCDYLAVQPTDAMVFAPLREWQGRYLLPVINFDNRRSTVGLPLPVERMELSAPAYEVWDLMAERLIPGPDDSAWRCTDLAQLKIGIEPYQVLLLDFRPILTNLS